MYARAIRMLRPNPPCSWYTPFTVFTKAIVRPPGQNFGSGETSVELGEPNHDRALQQHAAYVRALASCGLELITLPPDERHPDSTFVEDTAIVTARGAVITRPGADSRRGETEEIERVLRDWFPKRHAIVEPGTVDGGDICEAGNHFFIGISRRTNEAGAGQLSGILAAFGYSSSLIDIRGLSNILHLKSGMTWIGGSRLVVIEALRQCKAFSGYELVHVNSAEEYAANCVNINGTVLIPAGFPKLQKQLEELGYSTIALEMSEFQKMDGGLSCLSLRF
jgi:dimethylargininase